MRNRTFAKDIFRSITHSWSRFWAIFAIVALGAGFFAGLRATGTDMQATGDAYYDQSNMMDIELISTLGFTGDDVASIAQTEGVQNIMAVHRADVLSEIGGEERAIRIHGLPDNGYEQNADYMNRPILKSGRMPKNPGECVIGTGNMHFGTLELGCVITLEDEDGTLGDTIRYQQYTVVGFVNSAYYVSFTLGNTNIGNGTLSYFMYVPDSDFAQDVYTDVFVTVDGVQALSSFSNQYDAAISSTSGALEILADEREPICYDEIVNDAQDELEGAQSDYDEAKREADEKLADAKQQLDDAKAEIEENERKLDDAKALIDKNERKLHAGETEIAQNESQLTDAQQQYDDGVAALQAGWDSYNTSVGALAAQQQQWQEASEDVTEGLVLLDAAEAAAGGDPDALAAIALQREQLLATQAQLILQKAQLDAYQLQMDASKAELEQNEQHLGDTKVTLDAGWSQLAEAKSQLRRGKAKLRDAKSEYEDGAGQLEDAKAELADGQAEYDQSKADAEAELADAQAQIDEGYEQLRDLEPPVWYVLDRNDNAGYASFEADTGRMDSLSSVFPVIFFLVAALVALTTMTRMVEEERMIIGTYKALGYSNLKIASKYLIYALLASVFGGVLGVIIGFRTLPVVCWNAYRLMYTVPDLIVQFNVEYAVLGCAAATFCTLAATASVCRTTLAAQPASLMLPRAPKSGKRIWLESVPFIWKRLSFTWKVTCRNLFLYKKRLIMTIVGIAGCTGLLLTGFGIKNSVSNILNYQYDNINRYDTIIGLPDDTVSDPVNTVLNEHFSGWLKIELRSADIYTGDGSSSLSGYLYIPEDTGKLKDFISLHERVSKHDIPFGSNSVVMTEKLARTLGIGVGDQVALKSDDEQLVTFTVTGVTENYVFHYIYIDPALYRERMGEEAQFNALVADCTSVDAADRLAVSDALLDSGGVNTVSFTEDVREKFDSMIITLNYIVLVLIFSAGALAFVVLYNLTNINVTERRREIATIKVLGFYDREVSAYIYRETSILTIIGCVLGLVFGVFMHAFVVQTVEVDNVMFGRDIAPLSFIWSALLTLVFSVVVDLVMYRKLRKISMTDNLKSVD